MNRRSSWEDGLAQSLVGLAILLLIIAIIVGAWLAVRAANQIARGFAADGRSRWLWVGLLVFVLLLLGAVIAASVVLLIAAGAALVVLVVTARAVELGHADRFQSPPSLENIRHDMLHEWWPMEDAA
jgi:hypothetical protein